MNNSMLFRLIACAVILTLTASSINAYAGELARKPGELRHEAFLRGGNAISEALTAKPLIDQPASASLVPPAMPKPAMPSAPRQEGKSRRALLWIGIGVTGVIA